MTPIKLYYHDRYHLWADLIRGSTDRMFVQADVRPPIGGYVPLEIHIDEQSLPIVTRAAVVGWRAESERFSRGVFVRVPASELEKCRRFLGLRPADVGVEGGRGVSRVQVNGKVHLGAPFGGAVAELINMSETGLLVRTVAPLEPGQVIDLRIELSAMERTLTLSGEVAWSDSTRQTVAFKICDLTDDLRDRLRQQVSQAVVAQRDVGRRSSPILVADDDPAIVKFLAAALARHGAEVYQASGGEETLRLARELHPSLVVMDILMPGVDGAEVCKAMRADAELADVPVIFVSALDPQTLHRVADDAGATDYLLKPVALTDLFNIVGRYLVRTGHEE
ncbi:MAG: response regulator [Myxococcota bacterium]